MKCVSGMLLPEFNHCLLSDKECEKDKCPQWQSFTQFDRIKNFNVEEMAEGITAFLTAHINKYGKAMGFGEVILTAKEKQETINEWKQWLESEVDTE